MSREGNQKGINEAAGNINMSTETLIAGAQALLSGREHGLTDDETLQLLAQMARSNQKR